LATNFPTSLDSFTDPTAGSALNSPSHAGQHTDKNDAVEALEAKVGVDGSAVTTSIDYKLANSVVLKTLVDAKGDIIAATAADTVARLGVGTNGQVLSADSAQSSGLAWVTPSSGNDSRILITGLASDASSNSTTTGVKITGLDTTVGIGRWIFKYVIRYQSAAATTGVSFGVNHTGTTTAFVADARYLSSLQTGSTTSADQTTATGVPNLESVYGTRTKTTTAPDLGATVDVDTANADMMTIVEGFVVVTASGNLELWHASEVAAASTVKEGSGLIVYKVA
jgi:hypothetical protein